MMGQDLLTYTTIGIAVGVVVYRILKPYLKKTQATAPSCTDYRCSGCSLKETCRH